MLQFAADAVTCLAFGQKSARTIATGGDDKKVNLWVTSPGSTKVNCILSLSGHTTQIESVKFSHNEDLVCAGSRSGALKIWDLEKAKILRTLTGHKASIRSIDFHPYGDFLATGSLDSNIKLWDIRKKGCMYTYKGHTKDVYCLRFSPDGRWLASGGDEGVVKLWDLPAGKMLAELKEHIAPVTDVVFHPNEFLLSSCSTDGTVKFWDLETFQQVSATTNDAGPVMKVIYHTDGRVLFSAARDVLKIYGWEPARTIDTVVMGWGKVKDVAVTGTQLVAGTSTLTNVSVYTVDLDQVKPFTTGGAGAANQSKSPYVRDSPSRQSSRRSFVPGCSATSHLQLESLESNRSDGPETGTSDDAGDESSLVEIKNVTDFKHIFQPSRELIRTPPPPEPPQPIYALPTSSSAALLDFARKLSDSNLQATLTSIPNIPMTKSAHSLSAGSTTTAHHNQLLRTGTTGKLSGLRASAECLVPSILPSTLDTFPISTPNTPLSIPGSNGTPTVRLRPNSCVEPLPLIAPVQHHSTIKQPVTTSTVTFATADNSIQYKAHISTSILPPPPTHLAALKNSNNQLSQPINKPTTHDTTKSQSQVSMVRPTMNNRNVASNGTTSNGVHHPGVVMRKTGPVAPVQPSRPTSLASPAKHQGPRAAVVYPEVVVKSPRSPDSPVELIPETRDHPAGLDIDEFLPKHLQDTLRMGYLPQPEMSESEAMQAIMRGHKSLVTALSHRRKNIQIVLATWSSKEPRQGLEQAINMGDQSVLVDILNVITLKPAAWTLDMCQTLLPCIYELLQSKYECYMTVGCVALKLILKNFATMIKTNITAPPGVGVDISREERYNKCMGCYTQLLSIRSFILKRQTLQGKLGRSFRELSILMQNLE